MNLKELSKLFLTSQRSEAIASLLADKTTKEKTVYGLAGSSAAMLLASLPKQSRPMLVIGSDLDDATYLCGDLINILGAEAVKFFPSGYNRGIQFGNPDAENQIKRTEALNAWNKDKRLRFVVTYPDAIAERVASQETIDNHTITFTVNQSLDHDHVIKWLRNNAFKEVDYVYEPGQFATRGSILDIFGYSHEYPLRIDFFGDDIDSIRTFNIETQLSEQRLEEVSITSNVVKQSRGDSLLKFIHKSTIIATRDSNEVINVVNEIAHKTFSESAVIAEEGDKNSMDQVVDPEVFKTDFEKFSRLHFTARQEVSANTCAAINLHCSSQGIYHKNFDLLNSALQEHLSKGFKIYILSDNPKQTERLRLIFQEKGWDLPFEPIASTIHEGFVDEATRMCVFTDHQIFDRFHKYNLKSERSRAGKLALSLKELSAIEVGDYIVHVDHGVGRFSGLMRTKVNGSMQEMIKLTYQNNDIIFVSIHALHKLAKYRGKEGVPPKLNKLGTGAWNKLKERTKSKLKDIARDLIKLYAERKQEKGHQYPPDSYLQHELEASFIYEDTPDQLTATQAVKADMESPRPMDRLICGDVGFGKTEVAIRAAFKAATDNKQTAVLVPTTVLAYQHFNTFKERLKDFPVRVDYLSRARSPKQVKQILADLAEGKIDIIIGTHKLVGKDVKFKDLGLLVIDEEQKFGVAVKEKLKQLRVNVDTLTMSATPIPRTLQFSLMGARDLSAINTPPPNRYPIYTSLNLENDDIIAEAVNFEMSRNGQLFFINPTIDGLYALEEKIKRLVPDARTVVGHGQMPPDKLEKVIIDFANHDYDILISTTIIESGIDMPNVNTIVINNAHRFGLSELHQLRGRVGRSARKAFCYLLVPVSLDLKPDARRRLRAIENCSELGSGIQIAMQDLDIRGAGNLLGAEQSGFIADLGYETYKKILDEAVIELRTEEFADVLTSEEDENEKEYVSDCVIESDMELLLPADYVPQDSERIRLYKELDNIERELDLIDFKRHLEDRFGKIPDVTAELLRIPRLRRLARQLGIEKVSLKQGAMYLFMVDDSNRAYYLSPMFGRILSYLQQNVRRCQLRENNGRRSVVINSVARVETAVEILNSIQSLDAI